MNLHFEELTGTDGARIGVASLDAEKSLNALSLPMINALRDQLDAWAKDPQIVCVLLRGHGAKAFCAGGDVQALSSQFNVAASREGQGWRLRLTPKSAMLAKAFESLTLQGDRYVRQVEIVEANKDRTQIQFSALSETPATLNADEARRFE